MGEEATNNTNFLSLTSSPFPLFFGAAQATSACTGYRLALKKIKLCSRGKGKDGVETGDEIAKNK